MEQVEEIKAKATTECQDFKSSIAKLESELVTSTLQVGSLQAKLDTNLKESQDLQNQLDAAKTQVNQHEKEIQAKNIEVEDLNLQFERYKNTTIANIFPILGGFFVNNVVFQSKPVLQDLHQSKML